MAVDSPAVECAVADDEMPRGSHRRRADGMVVWGNDGFAVTVYAVLEVDSMPVYATRGRISMADTWATDEGVVRHVQAVSAASAAAYITAHPSGL